MTQVRNEILLKLKERKAFVNVIDSDIEKGYELSKKVKPFERPEETLSPIELSQLSAFYEYSAIEKAEALAGKPFEEFPFDPEDLDDDLDDEENPDIDEDGGEDDF